MTASEVRTKRDNSIRGEDQEESQHHEEDLGQEMHVCSHCTRHHNK